MLAWELTEARQDRLAARLEWSRRDLLAVFPFRHRLELVATLCPDRLTLETTLVANRDGPVPVSFGFHPYFGLPELPRADWRLQVPAMRRLVLDRSGEGRSRQEEIARRNATWFTCDQRETVRNYRDVGGTSDQRMQLSTARWPCVPNSRWQFSLMRSGTCSGASGPQAVKRKSNNIKSNILIWL